MSDFMTVNVYRLNNFQFAKSRDKEQPIINSVIELITEKPEMRCSKRDCWQDYSPG
jgi:hypothetical protein